jgi:predicted TIM-barrel fold metal-dependent hydrolase
MGAREAGPEDDVGIIDADTHYTEPFDLWTSRAPAGWKDRVPRVVERDGKPIWLLDGRDFGLAQLSCCILKNGQKAPGYQFRDLKLDQITPGAYDVDTRLAYMDEEGIRAQIVYPNLLGFGNSKSLEFEPALRAMCTTIYNDAMAELQAKSNERLLPQALIPFWDIQASVAEVRRARKNGLRGVAMNSDPQEVGLPSLRDRAWDPLWEALAELEMPINFHIGSSQTQNSWFGTAAWPGYPDAHRLAIGSTMIFVGNGRVICNLLMSGVLERFPTLRFVSVESGVGWLPFLLEALDYQAAQAEPEALDYLTMKPSEYFKRQMYSCFWFERRELAHSIRSLGADNVLFETDYPHPTCLYPDARGLLAEALAPLTEEERRKVLHGNAAKLYGIR